MGTSLKQQPSTARATGWSNSVARQAWTYLAVTFPLSWVLWVPVMMFKNNPVFLNLSGGPAIAAILLSRRKQASQQGAHARVIWFSILVPLFWTIAMLSTSWSGGFGAPLGFNLWLVIPAMIPAWIVSGAWSMDRGVRELMQSLVRPPNWRWPAIALVAFPAFLLIPASVAPVLHLPVVKPMRDMAVAQLIAICAIRLARNIAFGGVLEEPGWRGFLLARLQQRFSPLIASLLLWLPWALWHAPLDFTGSAGRSLMNYLQIRVIFFIPITILLTWLYNRSGQSLLSVTIFHGAFNTFPFVLPYAPSMLSLLFVWAGYAVLADRMWRRTNGAALMPAPGSEALTCREGWSSDRS